MKTAIPLNTEAIIIQIGVEVSLTWSNSSGYAFVSIFKNQNYEINYDEH